MMMSQRDIEHVDVLIVGASISGIGAAHHLQEQCPEKSFLILDAKESYGGTWLQHTYPGARSDSDMFTYGYKFKPWISDPIASRDAILTYLGEVIRDEALERHMLFQHRVIEASWSSDDQAWMVKAACGGDGEVRFFSCSFLWMCSGYYRLSEGHIPQWKGMDEYRGQIVHPQTWPQDLDYRGKRVVVIGSGATAATLIPAMAPDCESLTMLQRSPTYYWTKKNQNELADTLRKLDVPDEWVHEIVRSFLKITDDAHFKDVRTMSEVVIVDFASFLERNLGEIRPYVKIMPYVDLADSWLDSLGSPSLTTVK